MPLFVGGGQGEGGWVGRKGLQTGHRDGVELSVTTRGGRRAPRRAPPGSRSGAVVGAGMVPVAGPGRMRGPHAVGGAPQGETRGRTHARMRARTAQQQAGCRNRPVSECSDNRGA